MDIVIVNYQTPDITVECLKSIEPLLTSRHYCNSYIVDNNSCDGSAFTLSERIVDENWESACILSSPYNNGFSAGNNIGINASSSEFVLLLNSDTIVRPGAIETLVKTLQDNPQMGMASPRLEWPDGKPQESCFRFHRPINELIRSACTGPITKLFKRYEVPLTVCDEMSYPEWTSFACVLIRRQVFEQVGLLDDKFFMYFEDVDFCRRARAAGWPIINNPQAHVVHLRGGSSPVKSQAAKKKRLPRYFYESRTRYYYKHFGRSGLLMANLCWHLGAVIGKGRQLFSSGYLPNICESQWRDIWTNFTRPNAPYIHPDNY